MDIGTLLQYKGEIKLTETLPAKDNAEGDLLVIGGLPDLHRPAIAYNEGRWQLIALEDDAWLPYGTTPEELADIRATEAKISKWLEEQQKHL
jgi:hypothetical protein